MSGVHRFLTHSAERSPDHPVYAKDGEVTSYASLERDARRFAAGLRRLGIQAGDRVALLFESDVRYLVAYYGVLKAGGVVVQLSADSRPAPLRRALHHAGARAIVMEGAMAAAFSPEPGTPLCLAIVHGQSEPITGLEVATFQAMLAEPDELDEDGSDDAMAVLVYTSGTTGAPKGVMLSHGAIASNTRGIAGYLGLGANDRVGMVLPYHYSYGSSVLNTHVFAGATVVELGNMTYPADTLKRLGTEACTGFSGVPATYARLLDAALGAPLELPALRYLTQAGARLTPELGRRVRDTFPHARLFVMYGQTEAVARLTYLPPELYDQKPNSVGKPLPGGRISIRDETGQELPHGEIGEVVAEGPNLMLGYYGDPEATARVLGPHGLRTGDLGYLDRDGCLFLTGRQSELIKSGAHRISPVEIEEALLRVEGVVECGVCGVPDPLLGEAVLAYLVVRSGTNLAKRSVLATCFEELPRFKLPKYLRIVERLPRTTNGKLRRTELAAWFERGEGTAL